MPRIILAVLVAVCAVSGFAQTPDYAREQRIADEIVPAIVVGDPVRLPGPEGRSFVGILTSAPHAKGAVVLVHGNGVNPDWGLIGELRSNLAEAGYTTLSIQMPVLAADAKVEDYTALFPDAARRIAAAVNYLQAKEFRKIALVSHSMGSRMSNEYVLSLNPVGTAPSKVSPITVWVALSIPADYRGGERFRIPVFDLYGADDLPAVLANAARRRDAIAKISGSKSASIAGADHYFNGHYKELDAEVRGFLDQALR